ncbi:flagellar assembly protein H [Microcoleus sp. herbarium12]|uniref:flagellar assembly protein H n=1 Tax=Microcoleus sp. herbarium12 TaxID=3055437 RepID=UPI002FD60ED9
MTRLIHDRFAKEYLEEMLSPLGTVNIGRDVTSEVREIDVYFTYENTIPEHIENLGLLGRLATATAIFEPFRNPVTIREVVGCISKLFDIQSELEREARRDNIRVNENDFPKLWILTPTASESLLNGFRAQPDEPNWMPGIYFLGESMRSAIVVIHQLPKTPETLWLRILGKGKVQERAVAELSALATDNPLRTNTLELLYRLQSNLVADLEQPIETEDRELIMTIAPLFQEQLQAAQEQGIEQGIEQGLERGLERGRQEQQRLILENFMRARFGELDSLMIAFFSPVSRIPAAEFTVILLGISMLAVDAAGKQEAVRLLAENVLALRLNQSSESLPTLVANLLALPMTELTLLLEELPQLSTDELMARLG